MGKYRFTFDQQLAEIVVDYFKPVLIGKSMPVTLGVETIEVPIDDVISKKVEENSYDVVVISRMENITFREIYLVLSLNVMNIFQYLESIDTEFPYERLGIGLTKLVPERHNGIDIFIEKTT